MYVCRLLHIRAYPWTLTTPGVTWEQCVQLVTLLAPRLYWCIARPTGAVGPGQIPWCVSHLYAGLSGTWLPERSGQLSNRPERLHTETSLSSR
jgi:hypothetical protein